MRGLQRMVEDERYCADILTQISSVQEALRAVGRELMRNHLKHCATEAIRHGGAAADAMYDELVDLIDRHATRTVVRRAARSACTCPMALCTGPWT